jgi:hypothetical protein
VALPPTDVRIALAAFVTVLLIMAVAGWIGYAHWWIEPPS